MNLSNYPIDRDLQMQKIIEDTEIIISNFRKIAAASVQSFTDGDDDRLMYSLGKRLINQREENENPEGNLGNSQVNII